MIAYSSLAALAQDGDSVAKTDTTLDTYDILMEKIRVVQDSLHKANEAGNVREHARWARKLADYQARQARVAHLARQEERPSTSSTLSVAPSGHMYPVQPAAPSSPSQVQMYVNPTAQAPPRMSALKPCAVRELTTAFGMSLTVEDDDGVDRLADKAIAREHARLSKLGRTCLIKATLATSFFGTQPNDLPTVDTLTSKMLKYCTGNELKSSYSVHLLVHSSGWKKENRDKGTKLYGENFLRILAFADIGSIIQAISRANSTTKEPYVNAQAFLGEIQNIGAIYIRRDLMDLYNKAKKDGVSDKTAYKLIALFMKLDVEAWVGRSGAYIA